jgi:uncharacterized membrane protein
VQRIDWIRQLFPVLSVIWALALPAAAAGSSPELRHRSVAVVSGAVYVAGAVVCHQQPGRSFGWNGRPWPVCARCTGIYEGAAVVSLGLVVMRRRRAHSLSLPARREAGQAIVRAAAIAAVVPTAVTLAWEWSAGRAPGNEIRALAGLPIGAVVAWIVTRTPSWRAVGVN